MPEIRLSRSSAPAPRAHEEPRARDARDSSTRQERGYFSVLKAYRYSRDEIRTVPFFQVCEIV